MAATQLPDDFLQARAVDVARHTVCPSGAGLSKRGQRLATTPFSVAPVHPIGRAFRANQPALNAFPLTLWSQVAGRRLRRAPRTLLAHGDARGYAPLREADRDVAELALAHDLEVLPISTFSIAHPVANGLLLGFANVAEEVIT